MRVASYNMRKAVGLDWRRDADRILRVLGEINADVVVLQESDKRIGARAGVLPQQDMFARLGYRIADLSVRPLSHGWHGNAVLYRENAVSFESAQRIVLPTLEPRGAVSMLLLQPQLEVVGVHLGLTRGSRVAQLRALSRYLETVTHPVLIAGDFNAWRRDEGIDDALGDRFTVIQPGNSFHAARPVAALDRFALKGNVNYASAWVHNTPLAKRASDHLPIVIDLELPKDPA